MNTTVEQEYRMVRKTYMCHVCEREFKKMAPVLDLVEVQCPTCNESFCEEVSSSQQSSSPRESQQEAPRSSPPSPPLNSAI